MLPELLRTRDAARRGDAAGPRPRPAPPARRLSRRRLSDRYSSSTSRSRSSGLNGLVRKRSAPACVGARARGVVGGRGQHHDLRARHRRLGAHLAAGLDAVQARHVDVEEDEPRTLAARDLHRLLAVARLVQLERRHALERRHDELADERVVVDDQHDVAGRLIRSPAGCARASRRAASRSASMTSGSKCVPLPCSMITRACAIVEACRYGRFVVSASSVSATAKIRAEMRDRLAGQPVGVARAVPALVVVADDVARRAEEVDVAHDLRSRSPGAAA